MTLFHGLKNFLRMGNITLNFCVIERAKHKNNDVITHRYSLGYAMPASLAQGPKAQAIPLL